MSMLANAARLRPVAVASILVLGLGLGGCANYETLEPYQPASGVQTEVPADGTGVKVRNLMVRAAGGKMELAGSLVSSKQDDTLRSLTGTALKENNEPAGELTMDVPETKIPAGQAVNLGEEHIAVTGDVKPGGMTQMTLDFAKAGKVTLMVPVVDAEAAGIPMEEAGSSASPSATPGN
ncbi:hypothetical protein GCM10027030_16980 [Luteococcus sediminum]